MYITEKIDKLLNEERLILKASIKSAINRDLDKLLKKTYFDKIPLQDIFDVCKKHGVIVLQEDGSEWSGFLLGGKDKTEQVHFLLGLADQRDTRFNDIEIYTKITNAGLNLSYYFMEQMKK